MKKGKIGVQMFNLKNKIVELGAYETLRKIKELGYNAVEVTQIQMTEEEKKAQTVEQASPPAFPHFDFDFVSCFVL